MTWLPIYAIITTALLCIALLLLFWNRSDLSAIKSFNDMVRDKLARLNSGLDKLDAGLDWFLSREGLKLDYMHATWRWYVTSRDDGNSLYRTMRELDRDKREALAKALYEASLQAMRDFDKEKSK